MHPPVYIPELLADTVAGKIDASTVLDLTVDLDGVSKGYAAMDSREAIARHGTTLKNLTHQLRSFTDTVRIDPCSRHTI